MREVSPSKIYTTPKGAKVKLTGVCVKDTRWYGTIQNIETKAFVEMPLGVIDNSLVETTEVVDHEISHRDYKQTKKPNTKQ